MADRTPAELWSQVFESLKCKDLCSARLVCYMFDDIIARKLWKGVYLQLGDDREELQDSTLSPIEPYDLGIRITLDNLWVLTRHFTQAHLTRVLSHTHALFITAPYWTKYRLVESFEPPRWYSDHIQHLAWFLHKISEYFCNVTTIQLQVKDVRRRDSAETQFHTYIPRMLDKFAHNERFVQVEVIMKENFHLHEPLDILNCDALSLNVAHSPLMQLRTKGLSPRVKKFGLHPAPRYPLMAFHLFPRTKDPLLIEEFDSRHLLLVLDDTSTLQWFFPRTLKVLKLDLCMAFVPDEPFKEAELPNLTFLEAIVFDKRRFATSTQGAFRGFQRTVLWKLICPILVTLILDCGGDMAYETSDIGIDGEVKSKLSKNLPASTVKIVGLEETQREYELISSIWK